MSVVLTVLLGTLALLLLGLAVLLCLPLRLSLVCGREETLTVQLRALGLRITLRPRKKKKKKKQKKQSTPQKSEEKPAEKKEKRKRDYLKTVDVVLDVLDELAGKITLSRLKLDFCAACGDAARTADLLGKFFVFAGMLTPVLKNTFHVDELHMEGKADFEGEQSRWRLELVGKTRLLPVLLTLLRHQEDLRGL